MKKLALWLAAAAFLSAQSTARWEIQYLHDEDFSTFSLTDISFFSPRRGMAVGVLTKKEKIKPSALTTDDGGKSWKLDELDEAPRSLFFLDDSQGWMVTEKGLWKTDEAGRSWRKISKQAGLQRVHFQNAMRGWGVGVPKLFVQTSDGGKRWDKVEIKNEPNTTPEFTAYYLVDFVDAANGVVVGTSTPPRRTGSRFPPWLEPEQAQRRRQLPALSLQLTTSDGGKSWTGDSTSLFGRITRLRWSAPPRLLLVEFQDSFQWPAEVLARDEKTKSMSRIFAVKDRAVTDMITAGGITYLAAIEPAGQLVQSPIPGKLHILRAADLKRWDEMEIDYRAVGRRAILASAGPDVWVATDSGMILKLAR